MPPKKPAAPKAARAEAEASEAAASQEEPIKVNLYEPGALKHAMDDLARCVSFAAKQRSRWG